MNEGEREEGRRVKKEEGRAEGNGRASSAS